MNEAGVEITVHAGHVYVKARYGGGAYVDLSFGAGRFHATEVINVWDDETNKPEIPFSVTGTAAALDSWMLDQDRDNPGWYEQYIENRRY